MVVQCWDQGLFFFFNDTATTEIYTGWYTLSLHDALPISKDAWRCASRARAEPWRWRSEEHTSELQSHHPISYAVFCLKKKRKKRRQTAVRVIYKLKKIYNK